MLNLHHKPIKRFGLSGNIHDDSAFARLKAEYTRLLMTEMRLTGYAPRFDINPDFTLKYNEQHQYFEFELSIYGVYVGKKKSEWISGVDETRPIFIPQNKSEEFSKEQV
jgi:hypothetical protein